MNVVLLEEEKVGLSPWLYLKKLIWKTLSYSHQLLHDMRALCETMQKACFSTIQLKQYRCYGEHFLRLNSVAVLKHKSTFKIPDMPSSSNTDTGRKTTPTIFSFHFTSYESKSASFEFLNKKGNFFAVGAIIIQGMYANEELYLLNVVNIKFYLIKFYK